jgi:hypothetical protein
MIARHRPEDRACNPLDHVLVVEEHAVVLPVALEDGRAAREARWDDRSGWRLFTRLRESDGKGAKVGREARERVFVVVIESPTVRTLGEEDAEERATTDEGQRELTARVGEPRPRDLRRRELTPALEGGPGRVDIRAIRRDVGDADGGPLFGGDTDHPLPERHLGPRARGLIPARRDRREAAAALVEDEDHRVAHAEVALYRREAALEQLLQIASRAELG